MNVKDIKRFTSCGNYCVNMTMKQLVNTIKRDEKEHGLIMNPDFQREHVWTEEQQIAYIEYFLRGGQSGRDLCFNNPDWYGQNSGDYHDYVCVDGLQRITAVQRFMNNEIPAFGYFMKDFEDDFAFTLDVTNYCFNFHVNDLKEKEEVLTWYIEMNEGGVPHTKAEIDKVKKMLENLKSESYKEQIPDENDVVLE